ncbi:hypothetical protein DAPPUDRAFT_117122 [Daphnia pulex]|uniref:Uncharacterized protein n=1 Tax=Daphnia pulex TaxID=6669 RepID=E9HRL8_DAPPU|nr:hypothetical protein DAPPUDRAFT_117122 [Daphnia pulex]|eukprot:EFX65614.1 hypothetical protein DAPPUDRAFT_117122 [Daphnia pulex]
MRLCTESEEGSGRTRDVPECPRKLDRPALPNENSDTLSGNDNVGGLDHADDATKANKRSLMKRPRKLEKHARTSENSNTLSGKNDDDGLYYGYDAVDDRLMAKL